jgi:ribonuclease D
LDKKGRLPWMETEMEAWQQSLEETVTKPQWRRVSGIARLRPAQLAIVKELWIWRNAEAERRNRSAKRTLADDLIVELAHRGTSKINQIRAIRVSASSIDGISQAIETALQLPASEHPKKINSHKSVNLGLLGQFITTALNVVCHEQQIASPLVGTAQEVRDLAASKLGLLKTNKPQRLEAGWRADVVGQLIQRVLDGKVAIRVGDPKSNQPLVMESLKQ